MAHVAGNPEAGSVVPGSGGGRKLRWGAAGKGKSGGVRVGKGATENMPAHVLRQIAKEFGHADA